MDFIRLQTENHIAVVTVDRVEALNALNSAVLGELEHTLNNILSADVRCVIIRGAGEKAFVAGADIAEMLNLTREEAAAFAKKGSDVFLKLSELPVPTIAAVNGFALGGGCELAMSCDLRIASDTAVFAQPEAGLGILPGFGGTQRLPRLVGQAKAKELIFTGSRINAQEALEIGLVNLVCPPEKLMDEAMRLAGKIARSAPVAVRYAKKAMSAGLNQGISKGLEAERELFGACFETQDRKSAMSAFLEKRKPEPFANR